jgi:hypothetical protein
MIENREVLFAPAHEACAAPGAPKERRLDPARLVHKAGKKGILSG